MKNLQHKILEYIYNSGGEFFIDTANHFISIGENPSDVTDMIRLLLDQKHLTASARDVYTAYLKISPSGKAKLSEYQSADAENTPNQPRTQSDQNACPDTSSEATNKTSWYKDSIRLNQAMLIIAVLGLIAAVVFGVLEFVF